MIFLSSTIGRDFASRDVIGPGTPLHDLPGHLQPRKNPVSSLANLRDEDLRLLSVLTRRALDRLD